MTFLLLFKADFLPGRPKGRRAPPRGAANTVSVGVVMSTHGASCIFVRMPAQPRTRLHDLPRQRAPDDGLDVARHRNQRAKIDPGVESRFLEQIDQILSADVAGRTGSERASAERRNRGL